MKSEALALTPARNRATDFIALTKPRLNFLVVATTAVAFYLASANRLDLVLLLNTVVGTALVAGGAAALNQWLERDIDALMLRTRTRPLPEGRVEPGDARTFGAALAGIGIVVLALTTNLLAAGLALATLVSYLACYTPYKRRSSHATLVGALPGALPPMIGWAAARGTLSLEAWTLFAIVFTWQIPHFMAIAWLYRDDYQRAGLPLLPVLEPDGRSTGRQALLYVCVLLPVSLVPGLVGLAGPAYVAEALLLGVLFLFAVWRFAKARTHAHARGLFLASILYLPLLWTLLILNRLA